MRAQRQAFFAMNGFLYTEDESNLRVLTILIASDVSVIANQIVSAALDSALGMEDALNVFNTIDVEAMDLAMAYRVSILQRFKLPDVEHTDIPQDYPTKLYLHIDDNGYHRIRHEEPQAGLNVEYIAVRAVVCDSDSAIDRV